jgi:hypothetical protein
MIVMLVTGSLPWAANVPSNGATANAPAFHTNHVPQFYSELMTVEQAFSLADGCRRWGLIQGDTSGAHTSGVWFSSSASQYEAAFKAFKQQPGFSDLDDELIRIILGLFDRDPLKRTQAHHLVEQLDEWRSSFTGSVATALKQSRTNGQQPTHATVTSSAAAAVSTQPTRVSIPVNVVTQSMKTAFAAASVEACATKLRKRSIIRGLSLVGDRFTTLLTHFPPVENCLRLSFMRPPAASMVEVCEGLRTFAAAQGPEFDMRTVGAACSVVTGICLLSAWVAMLPSEVLGRLRITTTTQQCMVIASRLVLMKEFQAEPDGELLRELVSQTQDSVLTVLINNNLLLTGQSSEYGKMLSCLNELRVTMESETEAHSPKPSPPQWTAIMHCMLLLWIEEFLNTAGATEISTTDLIARAYHIVMNGKSSTNSDMFQRTQQVLNFQQASQPCQ